MMMEPNSEMQSKGGRTRDAGRPPWEKQFMGVLAGSSRPLKNEHPAATDAKQAVTVLKEEATKFPWVFLAIVGRDGRTVNSKIPDAEAVARVNQMGGAIGLAGLLILRDKLTTFARPFAVGLDIENRLRNVVEQYIPKALDLLRDNAQLVEEETSPMWAKVYTNGERASMYYWFEPHDSPPPEWELAGVCYVVPDAVRKGWRTKLHVANSKWEEVMKLAGERFMKKVKEVIADRDLRLKKKH
jgi:hypothetical protein